MNTPKWIVVIALVFALAIPATPVSAAGSVSITLTSPNAIPVPVGSDMDIDLVLSATNVTPGVTLAKIYLTYDPTLVTPLGVDARSDFFGVTDIFYPSFTTCGGKPCVYLLVGGPAQTTKTGAVARFRFRATGVGTANFEIISPNSDTVILDADGFYINISVSGSPISLIVNTVFRAAAGGTVFRQGMMPPILICTRVSAGGMIAFTDSSGNFTLTNLSNGTHTLRAEYPGYLASQKTITIPIIPPPAINVGITTLLGGDVNNDSVINISDIQIIINKFGQFAGVGVFPGCVSLDMSLDRIDINDDTTINIRDLAIAAGNFGKTGPIPWP